MAKKKGSSEEVISEKYKATKNVIVGSGSDRVHLLKGDLIPDEVMTDDLIADGFAEKAD